MLEIKVDATIDMEKTVDLNMYILEKKRFIKGTVVFIFFAGLLIIFLGLLIPNMVYVILGIIFSLFAVAYKKLNRYFVTKMLGKTIENPIEEYATITEEEVSAKGKNGYSVFTWDELQYVAEDSKNVYIFITKVQAFVIRKSDFQNDDLNTFWTCIPSFVSVERMN